MQKLVPYMVHQKLNTSLTSIRIVYGHIRNRTGKDNRRLAREGERLRAGDTTRLQLGLCLGGQVGGTVRYGNAAGEGRAVDVLRLAERASEVLRPTG